MALLAATIITSSTGLCESLTNKTVKMGLNYCRVLLVILVCMAMVSMLTVTIVQYQVKKGWLFTSCFWFWCAAPETRCLILRGKHLVWFWSPEGIETPPHFIFVCVCVCVSPPPTYCNVVCAHTWPQSRCYVILLLLEGRSRLLSPLRPTDRLFCACRRGCIWQKVYELKGLLWRDCDPVKKWWKMLL